ncbi:MAG: M10 family metallopeptidase C-terminal domain-containing protein [Crocinitomicaceae bacterium]|nr:M10 family metallopeptidase C-terminal domain-containing protein [Crocinitomicaceae bacterium]
MAITYVEDVIYQSIVPVEDVIYKSIISKGLTNENDYIDGILWGGNYWNPQANGGNITYSFWGEGSESFDDNLYIDGQTFQEGWINKAYNWSSSEQNAVTNALQQWSNIANINFVATSDNNQSATFGFYKYDSNSYVSGSPLQNPSVDGAMTGPGSSANLPGIGYFDTESGAWNDQGLQQGGVNFWLLMHEIGHGLGLGHPHDDFGNSEIFPGVDDSGDSGDHGLNQKMWTIMSYHSEPDVSSNNFSYGHQGTPMALDIAAIQYLYGANMSYKTDDDVYQLPDANEMGTFYSCIWDAGGTDEISNAGSNIDSVINLNDAPLTGPNAGGYLSTPDGIYGGFTIANTVEIENATGGNGSDKITGNELDNVLIGGESNDTLIGGDGDDILTGSNPDYWNSGSGEYDTLTGGDGVDTFVLGDAWEAYYQDSGYALITDFNWQEGDQLRVHGSSSDYSFRHNNWFGGSSIDTAIYYQGDAIALLQDAYTSSTYISEDFTFV